MCGVAVSQCWHPIPIQLKTTSVKIGHYHHTDVISKVQASCLQCTIFRLIKCDNRGVMMNLIPDLSKSGYRIKMNLHHMTTSVKIGHHHTNVISKVQQSFTCLQRIIFRLIKCDNRGVMMNLIPDLSKSGYRIKIPGDNIIY